MQRVVRRRRGMALIEVMVTIAIVVTLMAIVAMGVMTTWQWARVDLTKLTMGRVGQQVEVYRISQGRVPTTAEGLAEVTGAEVPQDAWQRPIGYASPASDAAYALTSLGADGEPGGTRWNTDLEWEPEGSLRSGAP